MSIGGMLSLEIDMKLTFKPQNKLSSKIKYILIKFKTELLKRFPQEILLVYVFGSVAKGTNNSESDIDILIVVNDKNEVIDFIDDFVLKTILDGGPYLSIKLYDKNEYQKYSNLSTFFMREIFSYGFKL